jgi:signal transduction histidine kinase
VDSPLVALFGQFSKPAGRLEAAAALSRRLGVEQLLVFVGDPELGTLLPATGFPQTIAGGPRWRAFLKSCSAPGKHEGEVDYPRDHSRRVTAYRREDSAVLVLFGPNPDQAVLAEVLELFPLVSATLVAEQAITLARGEMEVAQAVGRRANDLAMALDTSRGDLERALAEAARLNDELTETDRRKDDFMAMLGHELRNPMAAISGAIEVMRARPRDLEHTARARDIIERQALQLARLVDDLLDVARITRGKITLRLEAVDVVDAARRAIEGVTPILLTRKHTVDLVVRARPHVSADRTRLEQMVTNLLSNAAKYTDPGGRLRVVIGEEAGDALICVEDNGIGIPSDMLPKIFDPFLQVDPSIERSAGGLGVGLTVVSRLAKLHHGSVSATSEVGKGSRFTIRLPISTEAVASAVSEKRPERTKKRILIVDDNTDSAEMMVTLAETWGHDAVHASDGPSAVERALQWLPDVVLLDIGLPGMDGYEVAAKLRDHASTREARIIAVSGYGLESDRKKSRAAGCDSHLVKPVDLAVLARAISE